MFYASRMAMCRDLIPKIAYDNYNLEIYHNPLGVLTFGPSITTKESTSVDFKTEAGITTTTGTTHNFSYTPTAGPKKCTVTVRGGLGLVTAIDGNTDAATVIKNLIKTNPTSIILNTNSELPGTFEGLPNRANLQTVRLNGTLFTVSDGIGDMPATRDLQIQGLGLSSAITDIVLKSISDQIHANTNYFTYATPSINIGLTNGAPGHLDGWIDPLITPGTGNTDAHWEWDAVAGKHKAISGGAAIWAANHCVGHPWTITYSGGISEDSLLGEVIGTGEKTWSGASSVNTSRYAVKRTAVAGTIGDIRLKCKALCNCKVAIYSDNVGVPGTLLAYSTSTSCVVGWNIIQLNVQVALTATSYWLVFHEDTDNAVYRIADALGIGMVNDAIAYAGAFENIWSGATASDRSNAIAGWGLKVV